MSDLYCNLAFNWATSAEVSMHARVMQITVNCQILLFLTRDFLHALCHVQGSEIREGGLITSELGLDKGYYYIEFTERFFSGYARPRIKVLRQFYS